MRYRLREIEAENKFCEEMNVEAITRVVKMEEIRKAIEEEKGEAVRVRKLNMQVVVLVLICMNIYARKSIGHVLQKMSRGLRFIWHDNEYEIARDSAFSYRRYQLSPRVMARVFRKICRPIATPKTRGAFLFNMRLMAIDGSVETVADTEANEAVFGRHSGGRGKAANPQVQAVYLAECGTHAIVDAGFWSIHTSERVGARRMLRSVSAGMLVMWDRGLHEYDMIVGVRQRDAHVLARLPANAKPEHVRALGDGSYLAYIYPSASQRRKQGERCLVRIIEYKITDPALADGDQVHRLITTLLDPVAYPSLDLVCAYHERWEIELVIDELDTHQRLSQRTLRSLKPTGVIQELYGLLLAHFVIRFLMHEAALLADIDPDRLSFVHAIEVITDSIPEFQMVPSSQHSALYLRLLRDIARIWLPERRNRVNPRVVKRKMSKFLKKRPQHSAWPQPRSSFRDAVSLI